MRWNELGKFLIISLAIIGGFCVYISPLSNSIKQGLDLQGGTHPRRLRKRNPGI